MRVLVIGGVLALGAGADASPPSYAPALLTHTYKGYYIPLAPAHDPPVYQLPNSDIDLYEITLDT